MNNAISTPNAPAAIGPYSQGIQAGSTIFVSGQLPIDPATGAFAGEDIASQTRQSLTNIKNILAAAGASMNDVVKTTVMLKNIGDFAAKKEPYYRIVVADSRFPRDGRCIEEIGTYDPKSSTCSWLTRSTRTTLASTPYARKWQKRWAKANITRT